jgi:hypothetical protein
MPAGINVEHNETWKGNDEYTFNPSTIIVESSSKVNESTNNKNESPSVAAEFLNTYKPAASATTESASNLNIKPQNNTNESADNSIKNQSSEGIKQQPHPEIQDLINNIKN